MSFARKMQVVIANRQSDKLSSEMPAVNDPVATVADVAVAKDCLINPRAPTEDVESLVVPDDMSRRILEIAPEISDVFIRLIWRDACSPRTMDSEEERIVLVTFWAELVRDNPRRLDEIYYVLTTPPPHLQHMYRPKVYQ